MFNISGSGSVPATSITPPGTATAMSALIPHRTASLYLNMSNAFRNADWTLQHHSCVCDYNTRPKMPSLGRINLS